MADESNDEFLREIDELLKGGSENEVEQNDTNHVDAEPATDLNLSELKSNSTPPVEDDPPQSKTGYVIVLHMNKQLKLILYCIHLCIHIHVHCTHMAHT